MCYPSLQPDDTEEDGHNKLRAEIADVGEDELNYRAAHMVRGQHSSF